MSSPKSAAIEDQSEGMKLNSIIRITLRNSHPRDLLSYSRLIIAIVIIKDASITITNIYFSTIKPGVRIPSGDTCQQRTDGPIGSKH